MADPLDMWPSTGAELSRPLNSRLLSGQNVAGSLRVRAAHRVVALRPFLDVHAFITQRGFSLPLRASDSRAADFLSCELDLDQALDALDVDLGAAGIFVTRAPPVLRLGRSSAPLFHDRYTSRSHR